MAVSRLILASSSPRRFDLLKEAGFDFEVIKPDVEENEDGSIPIRKLTEMNARLKAEAVASHHPDAVIVAADTLVLLGDRVLTKTGRPRRSPADARVSKRQLSPSVHCGRPRELRTRPGTLLRCRHRRFTSSS